MPVPEIIVALLALAVVMPALGHGFVFDDVSLIDASGNPVSSGGWLPYRPVRYASYLVDSALGGSPFVFHLHNAVLHAAVAALVTSLARALGAARLAAVVAGLVVAWHPLAVESVAYVSGRRDLLCVLFGVGAVLAEVRGSTRAALALFVLSTGAKESGLLFAVPIAAAMFAASERSDARTDTRRMLAAIGCAIALVLAYGAIGPWTPALDHGGLERIGATLWHYTTGLAGWRTLRPEYPELAVATGAPSAAAVAAVGLLAATAALVAQSLRAGSPKRSSRIAGAWISSALLAVAAWGGIHEPGADRHAYLVLPPLAIGLALVLTRAASYRRAPEAGRAIAVAWPAAIGVAVVVGWLSMLASITHSQIGIWKNERTLWSHAAAGPAPSVRARANYARALAADGEYGAARSQLELAAASAPGDPVPHLGLAAIQCARGHPAKFRFELASARDRGAELGAVADIATACASASRADTR